MTLQALISAISPSDPASAGAALRHWDSLAKPLGSLGVLEEQITKIAALTGSGASVPLASALLLVFCADNGVIAQGISQTDHTVTAAVAKALGEGTSTVSYMAAAAGCEVLPVDIGMRPHPAYPGVRSLSVRPGTDDISLGPAMSRAECEQAILHGAELVREAKEQGKNIVLLGEMGIGNTTTTAAVSCALLGGAPELFAGRGAGLSDAALARKIAVVGRALEVNAPDFSDPVDIIAKIGGLDIAALCGACLGGARWKVPVILDGVIACAAALCAVRLCPACIDALLPSHLSSEPAAVMLMEELNLVPPIRAGLHLGEGSGAMLALSLLRQAAAVYNSGHTFDTLGIDAYTPQ